MEKAEEDWLERIRTVQQKIRLVTGWRLCAVLGREALGRENFVLEYERCAALFSLRPLCAQESILFHPPDAVQPVVDGDLPPKEEQTARQVWKLLHSVGPEQAQQLFEKLACGCSEQRDLYLYREWMVCFFQELSRLCAPSGPERLCPKSQLFRDVEKFECLEDAYSYFRHFVQSISPEPVLAQDTEKLHRELVAAVKSYIDANYSREDLGVKSVAGRFRISQGYLSSLFRRYEGIPLMEYANRVRLHKAQQLLVETSLSVLLVMERTGFVNESNFYKLFKREFGTTPKLYRMGNEVKKRGG